MTFKLSRFAPLSGVAVALTLVSAPAAAADSQKTYTAELTANVADAGAKGGLATSYEDPWTRRYRRRHYRHHRRGIDFGDVVAGVLVLGALATIVDAVDGDGDRRRHRVRDRDWDRDSDRRRDRRDRDYDSNGIANAADMCVNQVERGDDRVEDVSSARRTSDGWRVTGTLTSGEGWNCWIDNGGRIRNLDFGASEFATGQVPEANGTQWSDADYARARANTRTPADREYAYRDGLAGADWAAGVPEGPQPDYPGGPLPGEEEYPAVDADVN